MLQSTILSHMYVVTPPPPQSNIHTYIPTFLKIHISPFFWSGLRNPCYPINTPKPVYWSWLTRPLPTPYFNNVNNQMHTSLPVSLPLAFAYTLHSVVRSFDIISISFKTWSETKMNRLCMIFERIRRVPQQSGGSYSRKATRIKNRKPVPWDRDAPTFNCLVVNYWSHLRPRKDELVKLHAGHIFIRYTKKIYSLRFLHSSG